jgi:hypothetical protein
VTVQSSSPRLMSPESNPATADSMLNRDGAAIVVNYEKSSAMSGCLHAALAIEWDGTV